MPYQLRAASNGFLPDLDEVRGLIRPSAPDLIVLNSPANPTGVVLPAETVAAIVELAAAHDLWVLSDEVYDELVFEGATANAAQYDRERRRRRLQLLEDVLDDRMARRVRRVPATARPAARHDPGADAVVHLGREPARRARRAARARRTASRPRLETYRSRRDLVSGLLSDGGFTPVRPAGAFYQMVPLAPGADSRLAALDLVERGVATAPGSAFGAVAADHLRVSLRVLGGEPRVRGSPAWSTGRDSTAAGASTRRRLTT